MSSRKGPLSCVYSSREEGEGKNTSDALTQQLEYYKSIVKKLAPEYFLNQDGVLKSSIGSPDSNDSITKVSSSTGDSTSEPTLDLSICRQFGFNPSFEFLDNHYQSQQRIDVDINSAMFFDISPTLSMQRFDNYRIIIEEHLSTLGFLTVVGFSCQPDFATTTTVGRSAPEPSKNLRKALFHDAIFYSSHPLLFSTNNPSIAERLDKARAYEPNVTEMIATSPENPMQLCDDVRALIVYARTMFKLGYVDKCRELLNHAYLLCKAHFECDFDGLFRQRIMNLSLETMSNTSSSISNIEVQIKTEQVAVLSFLFLTDTLISLVTQQNYITDDLDFPENPEIQHKQMSVRSPVKIKWTRSFSPTLGKHTVFEGHRNGFYFDEMREIPNLLTRFVPDAPTMIRHQAGVVKFCRKIFNSSILTDDSIQASHLSVLKYFAISPQPFVGFSNLEPFIYNGKNTIEAKITVLAPSPILESVSVFACAICRLHGQNAMVKSPKKFPVKVGGEDLCTSAELIAAALEMLAYTIRTFHSLGPKDSFFVPYDYPSAMLAEVVEHPSGANPMFYSFQFFAKLKVITEIALRVFLAGSPSAKLTELVIRSISRDIVPVYRNYARMWPSGASYLRELYQLILQYPSNYLEPSNQ
jgi:hypothetical protein